MELCYDEFNILYSTEGKVPITVSEHLYSDKLISAGSLERVSRFRVDPTISAEIQAHPDDYYDSGYDRGHNAPNGDMSTYESQYQSFYMTNITPQLPNINRGIWSSIERTVRNDTLKYSESYITTGNIYQDPPVKLGNIWIPQYIYKSVYYPTIGVRQLYVVDNTKDCYDCSVEGSVVSFEEFIDRFGFNPAIGL